jgi:hypothetical protein
MKFSTATAEALILKLCGFLREQFFALLSPVRVSFFVFPCSITDIRGFEAPRRKSKRRPIESPLDLA